MRVEKIWALAPGAPPALVPLASIEVACGFPSPAQDYETNEIDLNEHLMPNRVATYLIRARGHSMSEAHIYDGDLLIVDRSIRPDDGHVVVAVLDGEMNVKRLRRTRFGVTLAAENREHPDIEVAELSELHIWGVVSKAVHDVLRV